MKIFKNTVCLKLKKIRDLLFKALFTMRALADWMTRCLLYVKASLIVIDCLPVIIEIPEMIVSSPPLIF